ncbi:MAG: dihydrofolate reductase family protein [Cyanobacteria bacterium P01_A01_bin.70]
MQVSVFIATTLDGFIARTNGDLDWLPNAEAEEEAEDYGYQTFFDAIDVLVMGRHTYETVRSFGEWPYGNKRVIVLSSRAIAIPPALTDHVTAHTATPTEIYQQLRAEGCQRVYIDGGQTIQGFLRASLVDDIIVSRMPVLIGSGIPLFGSVVADIHLRHLTTITFANGIVQTHYAVIKESSTDAAE